MTGREHVHRITSAQPGPSADLVARQRTYLIMMGTRMVAIVAAVIIPGPWRWVAIAAGVLLPYAAVVMVNAARTRGTEDDPEWVAAQERLAITEVPDHVPTEWVDEPRPPTTD